MSSTLKGTILFLIVLAVWVGGLILINSNIETSSGTRSSATNAFPPPPATTPSQTTAQQTTTTFTTATTSLTTTHPPMATTEPPTTTIQPPTTTFSPTTTTTIPPATTETSDVQITYIFYDGLVPNVESDEYVEITNFGELAQDLFNWRLKDINEDYPILNFSHFILNPSESIRVYTNEIHNEYGGFSFNCARAIWNNSEPDTVVLYNTEGQEISRMSY